MSNASAPVLTIARYTLTDEVRRKSFIGMFIVCVLAVFLVRGCYTGSFVVNGRPLDAESVILVVSKTMFHLIAAGAAILSGLLSMRALGRDRDEGMLSCILSKPITRRQYIVGKVLGLWGLSIAFMFLLHLLVFLLAFFHLKAVMPVFLAGSLFLALNLLFVVLAVLLLSLVMSDIMAFLAVMGVGGVSFVLDGMFAVSQSVMGRTVTPFTGTWTDLSGWTLLYYIWPKLLGVQQFAGSLIGRDEPVGFFPLYSLFNVTAYVILLCVLLLWRFQREDVA